jgi:uncharacterized protein YbjT (DUF2867 family)
MTNDLRRGTIALTGALGFVASRLVPELRARGRELIAIVRPGRDAARLERLGMAIRRADLTEPRALEGAFDGAAAVVHLSGMGQVPGLLPALERSGIRQGVFISSAGVHTRLESASAEAKRAGEDAVRHAGLGYTILRPSMIYGLPGDRNMERLLRWLEVMPLVPLPGGGSVLQQPIHVDDLVAAILAALERPEDERAEHDVGGAEPLPLRDVVKICAEELGRPVWLIPIPLGPTYHVVRFMRGLRLPVPVRPEQVLRLSESKAVDISGLVARLGVEPRRFRDGVRHEVRALRAGSG